jgi:hypothetical protein
MRRTREGPGCRAGEFSLGLDVDEAAPANHPEGRLYASMAHDAAIG